MRKPLTMAVAETLRPSFVSVNHALFTMGIDKDRDPGPVMPGVTWNRKTWAVPVDSVSCQRTDRAVGL